MFLLLDKGGEIIGKAHAMIFDEQSDDAPGYAEHRIFVHYRVLPEYQRKHIATALLTYVMNALNEKGEDKVILVTGTDNEKAIKLYESLGFKIYSREKLYLIML